MKHEHQKMEDGMLDGGDTPTSSISYLPSSGAAGPTDEFLSGEDLDLKNLSQEELEAWWNIWLEAAQATNAEDRFEYSHGVFRRYPF